MQTVHTCSHHILQKTMLHTSPCGPSHKSNNSPAQATEHYITHGAGRLCYLCVSAWVWRPLSSVNICGFACTWPLSTLLCILAWLYLFCLLWPALCTHRLLSVPAASALLSTSIHHCHTCPDAAPLLNHSLPYLDLQDRAGQGSSKLQQCNAAFTSS